MRYHGVSDTRIKMKTNAAHNHQRWHFWIDRGGTFTDIVARTSSATLEDVFIKIARDGEIIDEPEKDKAP